MNRFNSIDSDHCWWPKSTLLITAGVVLLYQLMPSPAWPFDRAQIEAGTYWSLLSGHFVHGDAQHLTWNLVALVLLGTVIERRSVTMFWSSLFFGMVAVDVGIYWVMPWLKLYCGLSGVLNTLWIVALGMIWRETRSWVVPLLGLTGICKLAIEMNEHTAIFINTVWPPVAESHLAGQIAGLLLLGILAMLKPVVKKTTTG